MAPWARASAGMLREAPPRKLTAPLDIASAAFTVSFSTRRSTVTCCSDFLAGFRTAPAPMQGTHMIQVRYSSITFKNSKLL